MLDYGRTFMGELFLTPTAYGPWVDIAYYDDSDLQDETIIDAAVQAQSGNAVLSLTKPYTISNHLTLPSQITLVVVNKGALAIDTGITFTVQGHCFTGGRIIHSGAGTMKYGMVSIWSDITPEGLIYAKCGSICMLSTESSGRLYVKQTGDNTNTGWVVK